MTSCVISQPRFFPPLHYLDRLLGTDVFVVLDNVQYNPRHEENRTRLKTAQGPSWLTVPMRRSGRDQLICDTVVGDQPWTAKALRTLENLYGPAPHYARNIDAVAEIISAGHHTLTDLDLASWEPALAALEPKARIVRATELDVTGRGGDLLIDICRAVGADAYVSGGFGRDYLDDAAFAEAGIELSFHRYDHPEYDQRFGEFVPFLGYLDALFNVGLDRGLVAASPAEPGAPR